MKTFIDLNGEGAYYCEKGDTLGKIAERFSTTERRLILDNNLNGELKESDVLYVKKHLLVHTVRPDETLGKIAEVYGVSADEILKINGISYVYPAQRIIIRE